MRHFARIVLAGLFAAALARPASAEIDFAPKVHASFVAERDTVAPGATVTVALEEDIRAGWHTYWINPGDAGAPTEIQWSLPPGWHADPIRWPYPKILPVGPLVNYGYEGKLWLLSDLHVARDAKPGGDIALKAAVSWLVCKDVCIPEYTTLTLQLRIDTAQGATDPLLAASFADARARIPVPSPWPMRYRLGKSLDLYVGASSLAQARPESGAYFPFAAGQVKPLKAQTIGIARDGLVLRMTPSPKFTSRQKLAGVLVLTSADGSVAALDVNAPAGLVPEADFSSAEGGMTLLVALGFALLGGLILNLMPCVLPVLAMKALALSEHAHGDADAARREGLAYSAGAILSFAGFGLAVLVLRASGAAVGWGFQLQEPILVACFALLMFAVGLNLSGVYEIAPVAAGEGLTRRSGAAGAFFTGVLAVGVAAPCTAPFMAAALGFALIQPAAVALAVFIALGIGFAGPFLLLGFFPALQRILPKPGLWMLRLRQVLAFPMYGAAVWLVWVLAQQAGALAVAATLGAMVVLAFALWLYDATRPLTARGRALGALASLLIALAALSLLTILRAPGSASPALSGTATPVPSEPYSAARLDALRRSGKPVFVDATAAWCITCLINEQAVLSRPDVRDAFASKKVAYLVADWTRRNAEITALLDANGRSGVPLYLYYAPGAAEPKILPQVLTQSDVLAALQK